MTDLLSVYAYLMRGVGVGAVRSIGFLPSSAVLPCNMGFLHIVRQAPLASPPLFELAQMIHDALELLVFLFGGWVLGKYTPNLLRVAGFPLHAVQVRRTTGTSQFTPQCQAKVRDACLRLAREKRQHIHSHNGTPCSLSLRYKKRFASLLDHAYVLEAASVTKHSTHAKRTGF